VNSVHDAPISQKVAFGFPIYTPYRPMSNAWVTGSTNPIFEFVRYKTPFWLTVSVNLHNSLHTTIKPQI